MRKPLLPRHYLCVLPAIIPAISIAGGGPNPIEGSSLATMWVAPVLGAIAALTLILVTGGARLAAISSAVLTLVLLGLFLSNGLGVLIALVAGPWIAFIWMCITLAIHFLSHKSAESGAVPEDSGDHTAVDNAVMTALIQYRQHGSVSERCPSCGGLIEIAATTDTTGCSGAAVRSRCWCSKCNGTFVVQPTGT